MLRISILFALGASACADPVVELSLKLPSADRGGDINMSCMGSVEVYARGMNFPDTLEDSVRSCVTLTNAPASFNELGPALTGKIDVGMPASGLASVEMLGRRGPCSTDPLAPGGDLVFYGGAMHIGDDQLVVPLDGILSCGNEPPVVVRPVDIIKLTTGTTKGDCAAAKAIDGVDAGASIGTLVPTLMTGVEWFGGLTGARLMNNVATISGALTQTGPKACIAVSSGDAAFGSLSCISPSTPKACATGTEWEAPGISDDIALASFDREKQAKFPRTIFGAVVNGSKLPVQGAAVQIDPKLGEVVYVELSGGRLAPTGGSATGPSGLFVVYTSALARVTITAGAATATRTLGAVSDYHGAALVVLP